jgi:hypothetical protein
MVLKIFSPEKMESKLFAVAVQNTASLKVKIVSQHCFSRKTSIFPPKMAEDSYHNS